MAVIGLRDKARTLESEQDSLILEIADYEDGKERQELAGPEGSSFVVDQTAQHLIRVYDRFGLPRDVNRAQLNYLFGLRVFDQRTGKSVKAFYRTPPKPWDKKPSEEQEGVDYASCEICGMKCRLRRDVVRPPKNLERALEVQRTQHMLHAHPDEAALYLTEEQIRAARVARG